MRSEIPPRMVKPMQEVIFWIWYDMPTWLAAILFILFALAFLSFLSRAGWVEK